MEASSNGGTPKSSIISWIVHYEPSIFLGISIVGNLQWRNIWNHLKMKHCRIHKWIHRFIHSDSRNYPFCRNSRGLSPRRITASASPLRPAKDVSQGQASGARTPRGLDVSSQKIRLPEGLQRFSGWWFGCHEFHFPRNIGFLIIPTDEVIFFRGVETTNQMFMYNMATHIHGNCPSAKKSLQFFF